MRDEDLEEDADVAAGAAVESLWGGQARRAAPALRSGLSLRRCNRSSTPAPAATLRHRTTVGPTNLGCGGFRWGTIFSVAPEGPAVNGFVVQKINFNLSRERCGGGRNDFSKTYWEGWQVRAGIVYIGTSASRHDSDGVGDVFGVPSTPAHKGVNNLEGRAKYIPGYTEPLGWGNEPEAGALPATTAQPPGWSDAGTIHRWIRNDFDCCPPSTRSDLTHHGG